MATKTSNFLVIANSFYWKVCKCEIMCSISHNIVRSLNYDIKSRCLISSWDVQVKKNPIHKRHRLDLFFGTKCVYFFLYKLDFTFFYHFFLTSTEFHKKQLIKTSNTWHRKIYFMDLKEYWKMCCSYCGNLFLIKRLNYINIMDHKSTHQKKKQQQQQNNNNKTMSHFV